MEADRNDFAVTGVVHLSMESIKYASGERFRSKMKILSSDIDNPLFHLLSASILRGRTRRYPAE